MAMVKNLAGLAQGRANGFGLKLSNTLEVVNHRPVFPANEKMMYMSGRALHPLTLTLAQLVTEELDGQVPISFCGGADARNFPDLVADGLAPGDRLHRPAQARGLRPAAAGPGEPGRRPWPRPGPTAWTPTSSASSGGHGARFNLARHAVRVVGDDAYARRPRPLEFKGDRPLGQFDCIAAPCTEGCPAHQNIPDYLWLVAHGRPGGSHGRHPAHQPPARHHRQRLRPPLHRALRAQFLRFPPGHPRDQAVRLRARGATHPESRGPPRDVKVAIVGAGPAGLSAAYFLASRASRPRCSRPGNSLGGMVSGVIPGYRLSCETLEADLERLRQLGVRFHFGKALGRDLTWPGCAATSPTCSWRWAPSRASAWASRAKTRRGDGRPGFPGQGPGRARPWTWAGG